MDKNTIFANKKLAPFLAITAALVWGAAYPFIKLGLAEFGIDNLATGSKTLFAGIRFTIAGLIVLVMARSSGHSFRMRKGDGGWLFLYALVNTTLHYFCFYIGVSNSAGSRASVLNSIGTFLLVFLSCAFFKEEHLTKNRIIGCGVGFAGLLFLNLGKGASGAFTFMGDGMIILNGILSAMGNILVRVVGRKVDALFMTGFGLFVGGIMLILGGLGLGGNIPRVTPPGLAELAVLVGISVIGFSLYNQLLQHHPVGKIAIFNSLIPIFGILLSCLLLGEPFLARYAAAALLVAAGVYVINKEK